jgi:hypothetical protein
MAAYYHTYPVDVDESDDEPTEEELARQEENEFNCFMALRDEEYRWYENISNESCLFRFRQTGEPDTDTWMQAPHHHRRRYFEGLVDANTLQRILRTSVKPQRGTRWTDYELDIIYHYADWWCEITGVDNIDWIASRIMLHQLT